MPRFRSGRSPQRQASPTRFVLLLRQQVPRWWMWKSTCPSRPNRKPAGRGKYTQIASRNDIATVGRECGNCPSCTIYSRRWLQHLLDKGVCVLLRLESSCISRGLLSYTTPHHTNVPIPFYYHDVLPWLATNEYYFRHPPLSRSAMNDQHMRKVSWQSPSVPLALSVLPGSLRPQRFFWGSDFPEWSCIPPQLCQAKCYLDLEIPPRKLYCWLESNLDLVDVNSDNYLWTTRGKPNTQQQYTSLYNLCIDKR